MWQRKSALWGMALYSGNPTGVPPIREAPEQGKEREATYPLGPHQEQGNTIWEQTSAFQPWQQAELNSPMWGMAMYAGFVEAQYPMWIPSYQPGIETERRGQWEAKYSGFVNEHNLRGI